MSDSSNNQQHAQQTGNVSVDTIVSDIGNTLSSGLSELMAGLLNSAQDRLFKMSDEADSDKDRARYFELMNQLRILKPAIAADFNQNIRDFLLPAKEFEEKQQKKNSPDEEELSLVDEDDIEGMVLVKNTGERALSKYQEQLSQLESRLEHLALKTDKIFKPENLTPTNICEAFNNALADNFDNANKKILFSMFDEGVTSRLETVYDSINNYLIDAGVLPQIKPKLHEIKHQNTRHHPVQATPDQLAEESQQPANNGAPESSAESPAIPQNGGNNISGFAMTAAPGRTYSNPNNSQTADQAGSESAAHNKGIDSNGEFQHYTAGLPASQVSQVLSNYIGTSFTPDTAGIPATENSEFFPQPTPQYFGHQEIIQALSSIQESPQFNQHEKLNFDGEQIKNILLETIAKTSGGAVTKRINQLAEKTIDFIELIFDAIIDDEQISDAIKALLLRLQIPIIKASMTDQEFFIYDNHPARILLDKIAEVGLGISNHTDDIYMYLDKLINNILGEYDLNTEVFQRALDDLNAFVTEQENITSAKEAEQQQELLRKHARATVLKSLRAITIGKTLPEAVHPLILKRWPTLMFNHYLTNGKENNEWINIILTLRNIVESVQPISSAEQLAKIISQKEQLFERTEKYLNISSNSKKDVRDIMAVFTETVQQHIDDANFTEEEVNVAEKTLDHPDEPAQELPIEEDIETPAIPHNIMPGMWFQLYMGEDRTPRRCKLSVILVEDANLMFVNHKGELVTEKSFDDFNDEIASNRTKIIMGHSAFENAFKTVINRLH
jgi:hypothetical protein